jgi:hypothetical protein
MRNIQLSIGVLALVLLSLVASVVAQQPAGTSMPAVTLTGSAEIPGPGDQDGRGTAILTLHPDKGEVCYNLTVVNIQTATAAHIHEGVVGKAGSVKVELEAPKTGTATGCKQVDATLLQTIIQNPANYYVNVHNTEFPQGAIRGQLAKK